MRSFRAAVLSLLLLCTSCLFGQSLFMNTDGATVTMSNQLGVQTILAALPVGTALGQSSSFDILITGSVYAAYQQSLQWYGLSLAPFQADVYLCDASDCSGSTKLQLASTVLITGQGGNGSPVRDNTTLNNDFKLVFSLAVKNTPDSALLVGSGSSEMEQEGKILTPYTGGGSGPQGSASVVKISTTTPIDLTSSLYVVVDLGATNWGYFHNPTAVNGTINLMRLHTLQ